MSIQSKDLRSLSFTEALSYARLWLWSAFGLAIVVLLIIYQQTKNAREIRIQPAPVMGEFIARGDEISHSQREAWGLTIAIRAGNVNPENVKHMVEMFKSMTTMENRDYFELALAKQAKRILEEKVTENFEITAAFYHPGLKRTWVTGRKTVSIPDAEPFERGWVYEVDIDIHRGIPRIKRIDSYSGTSKAREQIKRWQFGKLTDRGEDA